MTSTKKNYIYSLILNVSNILISIIVIPLLSRRLGSEQLGIYSYTNSIVSFFMLFALLGIKNYGNRLIAGLSDKREKSKEFLGLYILQIIISILVSIVYILYVFIFCEKTYQIVALVQTLNLLSVAFEINWFFYGNEEFRPALIVGIISKFIYFFLILFFVHNSNDLIIYTAIAGFYSLVNNLFLVCLLRKKVVKVSVTSNDVLKHLKPCLILFIPVISVSIYKIIDKIMLGKMVNMTEVGLYEQAEKIIKVPLQLSLTLETVMLPKMASVVSSGNDVDIRVDKYILNSLNFMMFLVMPIVFGIICIADDFVPLFLGDDFAGSSVLLKGLAISVIFIVYGSVIRTHYIIPKKKDRIYVCSVMLGAIFNVIFNLILIPKLQAKGAVIATIVAEFVVVLYQSICLLKYLDIKKYVKLILKHLLVAFLMSFFVVIVGLFNYDNLYLKLLLQIVTGVVVYILVNFNYIKNFINSNQIVIKIKYCILKILMGKNRSRKSNVKFICYQYNIIFNRELNLNNLKSFNEKINWIKACYYNPLYEICCDKFEVREYVKSKGLEDILIKNYGVYENFDEIDFSVLPNKFVLKPTNGSGGVCIIKDKNEIDKNNIKKTLKKGMNNNLYDRFGEWQYKNLKPRIIAEKLIESPNLTDYKFFCFNGKVEYIYIARDVSVSDNYFIDFYDSDWNYLNIKRSGHPQYGKINKPKNLSQMISIAEKLSKDFVHVRVDLYYENDKIYFGELTFTTGAGYGKFETYEQDIEFGKYFDLEKLKHFGDKK